MKIERCPTGIRGFDKLIEGGFVTGSVNIVLGKQGVGKSIFATAFLVNGATKYKEAGLFINFVERKNELIRRFSSLGLDYEKLEKKGLINMLYYKPYEISAVLERGALNILQTIQEYRVKRMVIDPGGIFVKAISRREDYLERALRLIDMLEDWKVTSIITMDSESDTMLSYVTDSLIKMFLIEKNKALKRYLRIEKMRYTNHDTKMHEFIIKKKEGIVVK